MKPRIINQPFPHWIADILEKFENGQPLSSDQLNFLMMHEKTLGSHELDLVIKYYLSSHAKDTAKTLSFTLPTAKIDSNNLSEVHNAVENLLQHGISHVDLQISAEQFMQFKAAGFNELVFWHAPQFLSRTWPVPGITPMTLYFQWGKLFGVVKLNEFDNNFILDGNVLIFFEDLNLRSVNQCVLDYTKHHKIDLTPQSKQEMNLSLEKNQERSDLLSPRPGFSKNSSEDKDK